MSSSGSSISFSGSSALVIESTVVTADIALRLKRKKKKKKGVEMPSFNSYAESRMLNNKQKKKTGEKQGRTRRCLAKEAVFASGSKVGAEHFFRASHVRGKDDSKGKGLSAEQVVEASSFEGHHAKQRLRGSGHSLLTDQREADMKWTTGLALQVAPQRIHWVADSPRVGQKDARREELKQAFQGDAQ
ncbi:hypothetical protein TYRP_009699 [Tyrophagus putrescentiae]|nr:hypothetical protein TYRP_009699 [Tyrophagus putrescentiae]